MFLFLGNHHLVPLLIPPDTAEVLDLLFSQECQQHCGIVKDNNHVFSNTKNSEDHTSMWDSLHRLKQKLPLAEPEKIKSISNRHRLNTMRASMDIPKKTESCFTNTWDILRKLKPEFTRQHWQ